MFKIRIIKNREFYETLTNSFYSITSNCKVFEFAPHQLVENGTVSLQSITLRQLLNGNSGQLRTAILTLGKTVKLQAIRKLCNRVRRATNVII